MSEEKKELKELNEEELEKVNGGQDWGEKMSKYLPADHGPHIGMYAAENYIGQKVYIVEDSDRELFYWGTLLKSWEKETWYGSERTHKIHIEGKNDYWRGADSYVGTDHDFEGKTQTLFLMH